MPETFECNRAITLAGPAGGIEAASTCPKHTTPVATVVLLHPHPLHGGSMQNKVVTTLSRGFVECGFASLRFNFRGVGASDGQFADTLGEVEDALAVIRWVRRVRPNDPVWLAGFSFGAYIALRIANETNVAGLVTVAPAIHLYDFSGLHLPTCPWLLIQGEADEVVPVAEVRRWLEGIKRKPKTMFLPGVGHFFHQRLEELRNAVSDFVPAHLGAGAEG